MGENGAVIDGRRYTIHSLERMAPDTIQVRVELKTRTNELSISKGFETTTKDYKDVINKYVQPRNIPPSVVEDTIKNGIKTPSEPGTWSHVKDDVRVITNYDGDVVTVYKNN